MKIKVSKKLKKLAQIFGPETPLYIVGGFVRDCLAGYRGADVDLTSSLTPDIVQSKLKGSSFSVSVKNAKLGTLIISCGKEHYEYVTFRMEEYLKGGKHSPDKIMFTTSIVDDCKRRDFTVNCIYYNILTKELVDFYGGQQDIKLHSIKCVETPELVFKDDGLRIMRMIRLSAELGFTIDENTYSVAEKNIDNLQAISSERMSKEFVKILKASYKYNNHKAIGKGYLGIKLIDKLNIWQYINKSDNSYLSNLSGVGSFLKCYVQSDKHNSTLAFLTDAYNYINRVSSIASNPKEFTNLVFGKDGINLGNDQVNRLSTQLELLLKITDRDISPNDFTILVATRYPELREIQSVINSLNNNLNKIIVKKYKDLIKVKAPIHLKDLAVKIDDIRKLGFSDNQAYKILEELQFLALISPAINSTSQLLDIAKAKKENKQ